MKTVYAILGIAAGLICSLSAAAPAANVQAPIVVTYDSRWMQIGFAGDTSPRYVFPAVGGKPKAADAHSAPSVLGHEAIAAQRTVDLSYPVQHGTITDWDGFQTLLNYAFTKELKVDPAGASVLMTEPALSPKTDREKLTKLMFDTFKVGSLYVATDGVLALYASGRTSGLVLLSESDTTHLLPIYEGYVLPHAVMRVDLGENDVLQYLAKLLANRDSGLNWPADASALQAIGESLLYVAQDYDSELAKGAQSPGLSRTYQSGGRSFTIDTERFRAPEIMFKPNLIGLEQEGLHIAAYDSVMKCDVDIRKDLYNNLVLAGSNALYPGMDTRLLKELKALAPASMTIKVIAPPERKQSVWIGGSILASLQTFQQMWMTRADYDQAGAGGIHAKSAMRFPPPSAPHP